MAIVQSLEQTKAGLRFKSPKNNRARRVGLPGITVEALRQHKVSQMQERMKKQSEVRGFTIRCDEGEPMEDNTAPPPLAYFASSILF